MARKFLTPIDLTQLELLNARIQNLASAPSSPVTGQIYYNTSTNALFFYNGSGWVNAASSVSLGLLSARPAASASNANTLYFATDNQLLYVSDGSTWTQADTFGSITAQTSFGASSSNGTSTDYARADHTHGTPSLSSATPENVTTTSGSVGTGTTAARSDHSHGFTPGNFALSSFGAPSADVAFNGKKITGLGDPTAAQDAATKAYVDSVAQGLNVHDAALVATTANLVGTYAAGSTGADGGTGVGATFTITASGALVLDGVTTALGDRILVKDQTTQTQNGVYTVTTAGATGVSAVLTRATDSNNSIAGQVVAGDFIFVDQGSTQANTGWVQTETGTSTNPVKGIKIGTDNIAFTQFSGAGTYTASSGVALSGNNFTFNPATAGGLQTDATYASIKLPTNSGLGVSSAGLAVGAGSGITVSGGTVALTSNAVTVNGTSIALGSSGTVTATTTNALTVGTGLALDSGTTFNGSAAKTISVDTSVVARKYAVSVGNGSSTSFTVTHNLGTLDVQVQIYTVADGTQVEADITRTSTSAVSVAFVAAPTSNQYRVVVIG